MIARNGKPVAKLVPHVEERKPRKPVVAAARLPMHHGDPFDRMLVAQAVLRA